MKFRDIKDVGICYKSNGGFEFFSISFIAYWSQAKTLNRRTIGHKISLRCRLYEKIKTFFLYNDNSDIHPIGNKLRKKRRVLVW